MLWQSQLALSGKIISNDHGFRVKWLSLNFPDQQSRSPGYFCLTSQSREGGARDVDRSKLGCHFTDIACARIKKCPDVLSLNRYALSDSSHVHRRAEGGGLPQRANGSFPRQVACYIPMGVTVSPPPGFSLAFFTTSAASFFSPTSRSRKASSFRTFGSCSARSIASFNSSIASFFLP